MGWTLAATLSARPGVNATTLQVPPASSESLASLVLPNATVTLAQSVAAGQFMPPVPAGRGGAARAGGTGQGGAGQTGAAGQGRGNAAGLTIPAVPGRVTLASANLGLGYDGGKRRPQ